MKARGWGAEEKDERGDVKGNDRGTLLSWKLLCEPDFLDTFKVPGLWLDEHVEVAGRSVVCVSPGGLQPSRPCTSGTPACEATQPYTEDSEEIGDTVLRRSPNRQQPVKSLDD
ncbi:uncharacterized protein AKAME5_000423000 [Lates japonicus]|uniref:Uncharacterized protein n=1 Tax=Lates japonicus TaxID=270547 RepID=A0AAD3MAV2_LATJO|nr:uncharacterized protein AKAME5_000423000 [Lates japonicus]